MPPTPNLTPVLTAAAWTGPDMAAHPERWTFRLDDAEIAEVYGHARRIAADGCRLLDVKPADVPLPRLAPKLARIRRDILAGHGFALLRKLPVDHHSIAENAAAYWTLGLHLGEPVPQNGQNHTLGHVKDLGLDYAKPEVRGYQTSARLPYHTDYSDVVGLLCLKTARSGGLSSFVSSVALYNEMLARRPDLAAALTRPIVHTRWGEIPEGRLPWAETPVFNPHAGGVVTTYVRSAIRKSQLMAAAPRVTDEQSAACDLLDSLAADPAFHLDMSFEPGDIQFLNNHWILHSRTAYEDHPEPAKRRHLLRLWLACADGPPLPKVIVDGFQGGTRDGRPNGIQVPGVPLVAPLEASVPAS